MKRTFWVYIAILTILLAGGCMGINGEERLQQKLLRRMENKYDTRFTIVESQYSEYPLMNVLVATLVSVDNPEYECTGYINSAGKFEDDYSIVFFRDELEDYYSPICNQDFVSDFEVIIEGQQTSDDLTCLSFEEYIERRDYYATLVVYLYDGKTDDEYADEIYLLLSEIDSFDGAVYMFHVKTTDDTRIYTDNLYNLNSEQGQGLSFYTHERLLGEIHSTRSESELIDSVING